MKYDEPDSNIESDEVREAMQSFESPLAGLGLPSSPERLLQVFDEPAYPQPKRHALLGGGQTVSIGRIRPCEVFDVKFVALVHNTIRGAAGVAILNAELLVKRGYVSSRREAAALQA